MAENLDDDDRFLIRTLYLKGNSFKEIAAKRNHPEGTVEEVIGEFKRKGTKASRAAKNDDEDPDFREAAFWFFQNSKYILDGTDRNFEIVIRKAETDYSGFRSFLEGETERHKTADKENNPGLDVNSKWKFVDQLWVKTMSTYMPDETEGDYESKNNKGSCGLVSVDMEETNINAVCQIFSKENKLLGCGAYVKFGDKCGILTLCEILESANACLSSSVKFDTMDGQVHGSLKPNTHFITDKELNTTFVAFDQQKREEKDQIVLEPLTQFKDTEEAFILYGYYHNPNNGGKIQIQKKTVNVESGVFYYNGDQGKDAKGMPMYYENFLIGLDQGKLSDQNTQIGISIREVEKWVKSNTFSVGTKVKAKWTDDFEYNATIEYKTESGYMVVYDDFDEHCDQPVSTLTLVPSSTNKVGETGSSAEQIGDQTVTTSESASVTTSESASTSLDKDDIDMVLTLAHKGKDADYIAKKLNHPVDVVQEAIDKNKKNNNENQNQVPFDEVEWDKFASWLKKNDLEKYADKFKEYGCHSVDVMLAWKEEDVSKKLGEIGVKAGSALKLEKLIKAYRTYDTTSSGSSRLISEINNSPMPANWNPTDELDLTEAFKKPGTDKASIGYACKQLLSGARLKELGNTGKDKETKFYVKSGTHARYFEITITWVQD